MELFLSSVFFGFKWPAEYCQHYKRDLSIKNT